jgi:hypothetical protein
MFCAKILGVCGRRHSRGLDRTAPCRRPCVPTAASWPSAQDVPTAVLCADGFFGWPDRMLPRRRRADGHRRHSWCRRPYMFCRRPAAVGTLPGSRSVRQRGITTLHRLLQLASLFELILAFWLWLISQKHLFRCFLAYKPKPKSQNKPKQRG